ncbi:MAG: class I SAM-dependent methyltransferase [Capsulimonas sp.]|uniref:class I SAM-dependent methyltransferase n=1 Tax=Capsulimonas sp. TaxID=2494211 RepID=UPI003263D017
MELLTARYLLTEPGRLLLAEASVLLAAKAEPVVALTRLRKSASPEIAAAAWEMAASRRKGVRKFGESAAGMYFIGEALEQASSAGAAAYHAARFASVGIISLTDLCGGVGGDAIAFARAGLQVTVVERDPARALFAAENARALDLDSKIAVHCADAIDFPVTTEAVWFDPARRVDKRRVVSPEDYSPPLSLVNDLRDRGIEHIGVKLAPGIDHSVAEQMDAGLEFLSDEGECKESLFWTGRLRAPEAVRATVLRPDGVQALAGAPDEDTDFIPPAPSDEGGYLYEPDPAVIRAHLIRTLAHDLNAAPVDPQIAYLIAPELFPTPFATAYEIVERFAYHFKVLQKALNARGVGRVVVKKRGVPHDPEAVIKQLKLKGSDEMTVVLTRMGDKQIAILCRRINEDKSK